MNSMKVIAGSLSIALLATACAHPPMGPTVQVLPGKNKPFEVFQQDDSVCRGYASNAVAGQSQQANNTAVGTAVVGTLLGAGLGAVLGAGLGAAIGGGRGAAIGAASGAVGGSAIGASGSANQQWGIQAQYNHAYTACMYSKGNQAPHYGYPPPAYGPPPGYYPPPPPPPGY